MNQFELTLNDILADTFNSILKFEESSLKKISNVLITVSETHLLEAIGKFEGARATVGEIASAQAVSIPTVTVALKKLESKGMVEKVRCENDGRCVFVTLTELGRKILNAHKYFHRKMVRNISKEFNNEEKRLLIEAMEKLNSFFAKNSSVLEEK